MPWTTGKQRFTTAFACFLAVWARLLPWLAVARLFKCSWGTVAAAVDTVVEYGLAYRDLSGVTHIGIDEISRKKGQGQGAQRANERHLVHKEAADRLQPLYPQMKVIYMSGYTDNAIIHHGVLTSELNFIQKPFTPKGLVRKVREVLKSEN